MDHTRHRDPRTMRGYVRRAKLLSESPVKKLALPRFHGQCYAAEAAAWNAIIFCSGVM